jgi:hypothetical protein
MKVFSTVFMLLVANTQVNINQAASYTLAPFCYSGAVNSGGLFDPTDVFTAYVDQEACGPRGDDARAIFSCPGDYTVVGNEPLASYRVVANVDGCNFYCYTIFACVTSTPTKQPTAYPTQEPTTVAPTGVPTEAPTKAPTEAPTKAPTKAPSSAFTQTPSHLIDSC